LTKFVKDLLGLDHLDALIEGLHDAGDVRRLRNTLPVYWEIRENIPTLQMDIDTDRTEHARLDVEIQTVNNRLQSKLVQIGVQAIPSASDTELAGALESSPEEPELQKLARLRRDIIATRDEWLTLQTPVAAAVRENAEKSLAEANAMLEAWRSSTGERLDNLFVNLREFFSDLPSPLSAGPERARAVAIQVLSAELERCGGVLARDAEDVTHIELLDRNIERARARAAILDEQIAGHASEAGTLAQALAGILPHINSEACPVWWARLQ